MVFSDDADQDTVPRTNRNFNLVERVMTEQLIGCGFRVFSEPATTMDFAPQGKVSRQDTQIIAIAREVRPRVDVALFFQIYASVRDVPFMQDTMRPFIRIDGRMIRIPSGQILGHFDYGSDIQLAPLSKACALDKECLYSRTGADMSRLASSVGATLAEKLVAYLRVGLEDGPGGSVVVRQGEGNPVCTGMIGTQFMVKVKNFTREDLDRLEEAMTSFECYEFHRVVSATMTETEYLIETRAEQSRLQRNLRLALGFFNMRALPPTINGNSIVIEKILAMQPTVR